MPSRVGIRRRRHKVSVIIKFRPCYLLLAPKEHKKMFVSPLLGSLLLLQKAILKISISRGCVESSWEGNNESARRQFCCCLV